MNKQIIKLLLVFTFVVGFGFNSVALAATGFNNLFAKQAAVPSDIKFAVVSVAEVVANSSEVQALKKEQQQKMTEVRAWLEAAKADVAKQKTQAEKDKLMKKYEEEFAVKQEAIKKDYARKLQAIDKHISSVIDKEAARRGYIMVFTRATVLSGGDDITKDIIKLVK